MSGLEQLGSELERAAARRSGSWPARVGRAAGPAVIVAALAAVAVIAVGAVVLIHGPRRSDGRPTAARQVAAPQPAPAAQGAAWARLLRCARDGQGNARAAVTNRAPDRALLAALGVLRRAWGPQDAAPAASCANVWAPASLGASFDVRYVRYVGPGPRGGQLFLVPAHQDLPMLRGAVMPATLRGRVQQLGLADLVCLIAVGGRSTSSGACPPLALIQRPIPITVAPFFPLLSPAQLPALCRHLPARRAVRARCLATLRRIVRPRPTVSAGVVRDGIATVDVYAHGNRLVAVVPVVDNVYRFTVPARVGPFLRLTFKDARGHVVHAPPVGFGRASATIVPAPPALPGISHSATIPLMAPAPPPSSASAHTAAPRHR